MLTPLSRDLWTGVSAPCLLGVGGWLPRSQVTTLSGQLQTASVCEVLSLAHPTEESRLFPVTENHLICI